MLGIHRWFAVASRCRIDASLTHFLKEELLFHELCLVASQLLFRWLVFFVYWCVDIYALFWKIVSSQTWGFTRVIVSQTQYLSEFLLAFCSDLFWGLADKHIFCFANSVLQRIYACWHHFAIMQKRCFADSMFRTQCSGFANSFLRLVCLHICASLTRISADLWLCSFVILQTCYFVQLLLRLRIGL